jgi:bifunctional non-homologous end joining protein LigD
MGIGTYEVIEGNYWKGSLHISLAGKKLKGQWVLRRDRQKGQNAWLIEKVDAPTKAISPRKDDESALTGRTMAQIAQARDAEWQSNRSAAPSTKARRSAETSGLKCFGPVTSCVACHRPGCASLGCAR